MNSERGIGWGLTAQAKPEEGERGVVMSELMSHKFVVACMGLLSLAAATAEAAMTLPPVSSGTLVIQLESKTGLTTSGGLVTNWADQASAAGTNSFAQATVGRQPTYVANAFPNGVDGVLPGLKFNGGQDLVTTYGIEKVLAQYVPSLTLFAVTKGGTDPNGLFDSAPAQPDTLRFMSNLVDVHPGTDAALTLNSVGTVAMVTFQDIGGSLRQVYTYKNGVLQAGPGANSSYYSYDVLFRTEAIGSWNGSSFFNGTLGAFLLYTGVLNTTDQQAVESYLYNEYLPEPSALLLLALGALLTGNASRGKR